MAKVSSPPTSEPITPAKEPAKNSPVRLGILIGLFVIVVGLLLYDFQVAKPATVQAEADIEKLFRDRNAKGVRKSDSDKIELDFVKPADIQGLLKKKPMWKEEGKDKGKEWLAECYWWGTMPHRNYIWVVYHGTGDNLKFNSQHRDSRPDPKEDYPGVTDLEISPPAKGDGDNVAPPTVAPMGEEPPGPPGPKKTDSDEPAPAKTDGETPAEPKPAEPKPGETTEPKPAEPAPAEPKPAEPKPAEPKPAEPKPAEPAAPAPAAPAATQPE